jgi:hypothetical protein
LNLGRHGPIYEQTAVGARRRVGLLENWLGNSIQVSAYARDEGCHLITRQQTDVLAAAVAVLLAIWVFGQTAPDPLEGVALTWTITGFAHGCAAGVYMALWSAKPHGTGLRIILAIALTPISTSIASLWLHSLTMYLPLYVVAWIAPAAIGYALMIARWGP